RDPRHGSPGPLSRQRGRSLRRRAQGGAGRAFRSEDLRGPSRRRSLLERSGRGFRLPGDHMKLHDLRPPDGSNTARTRVGRGIAAGKGKTAGRGTKGQKARAGSSIPPWFEGGQTPLHQRIPKLRGFRNPFRLEYEVVNLGRISALIELGALEA